MDHVDTVIQQWLKERGDLDVTPMATIGRISRLSALFRREMEATLQQFDLHIASFDVLATLLRSGAPYTLSPGELIASSMVTSGTMTNRLDQLEKAALINRVANDQDRRSRQISLSDAGYQLISRAIEAHVATQHRLTDTLSAQEQASLNTLLRKLSEQLES